MKARDIRRRAYPKRGYKHMQRRCPDDYPGCPNCDMWAYYDTTGRFPRNFTKYWTTARVGKEGAPMPGMTSLPEKKT